MNSDQWTFVAVGSVLDWNSLLGDKILNGTGCQSAVASILLILQRFNLILPRFGLVLRKSDLVLQNIQLIPKKVRLSTSEVLFSTSEPLISTLKGSA